MDMKGKPIVIEKLNEQLADELTAVDQYMVHAA
jgi:bacterioferritin (cytochrome b1)